MFNFNQNLQGQVNQKNAHQLCQNLVAFINANGGVHKWALQLNKNAFTANNTLFGGVNAKGTLWQPMLKAQQMARPSQSTPKVFPRNAATTNRHEKTAGAASDAIKSGNHLSSKRWGPTAQVIIPTRAPLGGACVGVRSPASSQFASAPCTPSSA